jgi:hypothetical protein
MLATLTRPRFGMAALAATLALAGFWVSGAAPAHAANLEVNITTDTALGGNNDCATTVSHTCSLRAAIQLGNASVSEATIIHLPAGIYKIHDTECTSDDETCGDFNVSGKQPITINGDGAATTIIDGNAIDRVFRLTGGNTLTVDNVTVRNGDATKNTFSGHNGGGFQVIGSILNLTSVVLTGNTASDGGGIHEKVAIPSASVTGAAVAASILPASATINLTDVTVSSNTAATSGTGGGIWVESGIANLTRATVSGNSMASDGEGAGIDVDGTATLTNVTITKNNAGLRLSAGGGIAVDGTVNFVNATVNHNTASAGANIDIFDSAIGNFKNSIFSDPQGGGDNCTNDGGGTFTSQDYNLEFPGTTCGFTGTGDIQNRDPLLGPLQDNGGPTQTEALGADSPAIDHVDALNCPLPATDQRGIARPQNGKCEIGAFEVLAAVASLSPTSPPSLPKAGLGSTPGVATSWVVVGILLVLAVPIPVLLRRRS